jgi:hypothetical protein
MNEWNEMKWNACFTTLEYWRRARERNMHFLPPDQPAYKKNLGKIGWFVVVVGLQQRSPSVVVGSIHSSVCVCVCLCFCLLLSAHSSETIPPTTKHVPPSCPVVVIHSLLRSSPSGGGVGGGGGEGVHQVPACSIPTSRAAIEVCTLHQN